MVLVLTTAVAQQVFNNKLVHLPINGGGINGTSDIELQRKDYAYT
jgi:hypothetical protein